MVFLSVSDRVLVKNQSTTSQKMVFMLFAAGAWARANDADSWPELVWGLYMG